MIAQQRLQPPQTAELAPPPTERRSGPEEDWKRQLRAAEHWIGEHPAASMAFALITGVALGWFVKRR